jgi:hypothetical protein
MDKLMKMFSKSASAKLGQGMFGFFFSTLRLSSKASKVNDVISIEKGMLHEVDLP